MWFYLYGGNQQGPIDKASLLAKIARGDLSRDVQVWRQGTPKEWRAASSDPELSERIPPPIPISAVEPPWYKTTLSSPNPAATLAIWLGLGAMFCYDVGIIPLVALGVSIYALVKARQLNGVGRNRALFGLMLSLLYTVKYLGYYGYFGGRP